MSDYLSLSSDIAALIGPTTDPTTDTENAAIVRLSGNTRTDALARALATVGDGSLPYIGVSATNPAGTISHAAGSTTLVGTGTSFTTDIPSAFGSYIVFLDIPAASDPWGEGYIAMMNVTVVDDTHLTITYQSELGTLLPAFSGVTYRVPDATHLTTLSVFDQWIGFTIYYDFPWCLYQAAYKHAGTTDGPTLMAKADLLAKMWWEHPFRAMEVRFGHSDSNFTTSPRQEALGAMVIWAVRGCPGASDPTGTATRVWNFLKENVEDHWADWFSASTIASAVITFDVRDRAYLLHYTTMLAAVHPDSTVRADCLAKALDVAVNYFARLQYPDGTWRATNPSWWDYTTGTNDAFPAAQPFLTGLLLNALIDLHRLIRSNATYATQAATVLSAIKLGIEGQMWCYGGSPHQPGYTAVTSGGNPPVRAMTYAFGGPHFGIDASTPYPLVPGNPEGARWNDPKGGIEYDFTVGDYIGLLDAAVAAHRFLNSTTVHAPFYAALYETDATKRASYLAFGDELLKSQWEYTDGDGYRSQWYTAYPKNKDWDEHMRAQMRGLAWRKMAVAGLTQEDTSGVGGAVADHLALSQQPAGAVSGSALTTQPSGTVQDNTNATVTSDTSTVSVAWVGLTGDASLSGTTSVSASAGAWGFTDLALSWTVASTGYFAISRSGLATITTDTLTLSVAPPPETGRTYPTLTVSDPQDTVRQKWRRKLSQWHLAGLIL